MHRSRSNPHFRFLRYKFQKSSQLLLISLIFYLFLTSYILLKFSNSIKWAQRIQLANLENLNKIIRVQNDLHNNRSKMILFWTGIHLDAPTLDFWLMRENKRVRKCPYNCQFTADKSQYRKADGIIFHTSDNMKRYSIPEWRSSNQFYIMFWYESPMNTIVNLHKYRGFFNWTATYRLDSDIPYPYGKFLPGPEDGKGHGFPKKITIDEIVSSKKKLVAWVVSNCDTSSNRENFVQELSQYLPIDIYGSCFGQNPSVINCSNRGFDCHEKLGQEYKFYLAFENSLCNDYVSEKFFRAMNFFMVPITYGYPGVYKKFAPPNSYIDSMDFSSAKTLAAFILNLDRDDVAYSSYFNWRKTFKIRTNYLDINWESYFCEICGKLHQDEGKTKIYDDIYKWWNFKYPQIPGNEQQPICIEIKKISWNFGHVKDYWNSI